MDTNGMEKIIKLFVSREHKYVDDTNDIMNTISNVLGALEEIIGLPQDNIQWIDVELITSNDENRYVIITFSVTYYKEQLNQQVAKALLTDSDPIESATNEMTRIVSFGVPLHCCVLDKEETMTVVSNLMFNGAKKEFNINSNNKPDTTNDADFNLSDLQQHQLDQLKIFNKSGVVH